MVQKSVFFYEMGSRFKNGWGTHGTSGMLIKSDQRENKASRNIKVVRKSVE